VTRALGIDPSVDPEIHEYEAAPRDIYLLCSDGLCDMVSDDDIGTTLRELGANLELACPAARADGQRQRRARQRIGYTRSRLCGSIRGRGAWSASFSRG
jgi:serine/threonine protein phosphatase PrpC